MLGKIYIQNDDGSYSELGHITDMPTITDEIEPSDNSISFTPDDYSVTMELNNMSKKAIRVMLGWKAKGPVRVREWRKAIEMRLHKIQKEMEALLWG